MTKVNAKDFARRPEEVAKSLLGRTLVYESPSRGQVRVRITEICL